MHTSFLEFIKILETKAGESLSSPSWYKNLVYADGVGLHTTPKAAPLKRGFVSAGCFRGRPHDLVEWFYLFYSRTAAPAKLSITSKRPDLFHPHPKLNSSYKKEKYESKRPGKEADPTEMMWMNAN